MGCFKVIQLVLRFSFLFTKPHGAIQPPIELGHHGTRRILEQILQLPDSEWNVRGLQQTAQQLGIPYKKLFHLFRVAVIDNMGGPPVMELIEFFGVAECRKRIEDQVRGFWIFYEYFFERFLFFERLASTFIDFYSFPHCPIDSRLLICRGSINVRHLRTHFLNCIVVLFQFY